MANAQFPMPSDDLPSKIRMLQSQLDMLQITVDGLQRLLSLYQPAQIQGYDESGNPRRYNALLQYQGTGTFVVSAAQLWAFKIYDTSIAGSPSITINGTGNPTSVSDTITPGINGVSNNNTNTIIPVSGSGVVYIAITLTAGSNIPNSVTVQTGATVPTDVIDPTTGAPTSAYREIGTYATNSTGAQATNSQTSGYLGFAYCASSQWW